jgi:bacterioferritin-associated ferredoxin
LASDTLLSREKRIEHRRFDKKMRGGAGVPLTQGRITAAIAAGATNAAAIGAKLKAGTNCGSCIPELKRLIAEHSTLTASTPQQGAVS